MPKHTLGSNFVRFPFGTHNFKENQPKRIRILEMLENNSRGLAAGSKWSKSFLRIARDDKAASLGYYLDDLAL